MDHLDRLSVPRVTSKSFGLADKASQPHERRRERGAAILYSSGRCVLNTNASELWHAVVRATDGLDPDNYVSRGGGNDETMLIGVYPVTPGTPGGTPVRLKPRKRAAGQFNVTLNVRNVFDKYPKLRFTGRRKVTIIADWDSAATPFLEIQLQAQLEIRTVSRPSTKAKADKDPKKDTKKAPPPPAPDLETEDELELDAEEE
jgi:hypothetical protein